MRLKTLLNRITLQKQEEFPFPDNIESYMEDFVPNILLKSETLQQAFDITNYEMEQLYEEAYAFYNDDSYLDSITVFHWLVLFNPYEVKYWMGYAASQQMIEQYEKALHAYAMVALLDCENPHCHYHAYECYAILDNKEDADRALKLAYQRCEGKVAYDDLKEEIEQLNKEFVLT